MQVPDWIGADWGTSNLRLWGFGPQGDTIFTLTSDKGMGRLQPPEYPGVLADLLAPHLPEDTAPVPLVICGMAGARQGWCEAPYLPLPARLEDIGDAVARPELADSRLNPVILPGINATIPGQEDVMRGEETQLFGLCGLEPDFEGVVCLPGTHSKWAALKGGGVTRFDTALTGELFALLSTQSVLRHAIGTEETGPHFEDGIGAGLDAGLEAPERLSSALFRTRAAALVAGKPPDWCRGYLSGLLVGAEIAAHRSWRGDAPVVLIGAERLCRLYAEGLARDSAASRTIDATRATQAGLDAARKRIFAQ